MTDILSKAARSALMSKVRAKGNRSTERRFETLLRSNRIWGWTKHPPAIPGRPDFYFARHRVAVFVDGCFWHACPRCGRLPKSRVGFWRAKIDANWMRDQVIKRRLRRMDFRVVRIWEHDLGRKTSVERVLRAIETRHLRD